ncbi:MAG: LCP family protein [Anaerolineales bacterium]|nr:LCP family protein [Anaerolineales bacterium]
MRRRHLFIFLALVVLLVFACRAIANIPLTPKNSLIVPTETPRPTSIGAFSVPADATGTPTPFQPGQISAISNTFDSSVRPTPVHTPSWGDYPPPSVYSDVPIPPPVDLIPQPPGQINILLLGSDAIPEEGGFRTDSIMLITLNTALGTAHITSFPRDLYVYIPGWTVQRINTALPKGGYELLAATFEYNLGVYPDHFVMLNFGGFIQGINSLGGLDVEVAEPISDPWGSLPAGLIHMDGNTALWYVRSRYTTSDFDRARRQQQVLVEVFKKLISMDAVKRVPELFEIYRNSFITDLTLGEITPLMGLASELGNDTSKIEAYFIGPEQVTDYRVPSSGAQVLLPDYEAVLDVMRTALNAPPR